MSDRLRGGSTPLAALGQRAGYRTQPARAMALGVTLGYMRHLERGAQLPSVQLRKVIAERFGVTAPEVDRILDAGRKAFARRMPGRLTTTRRERGTIKVVTKFMFDEPARAALAKHYGEQGIATRKAIINWIDSLVAATLQDIIAESKTA